MSGREPEIFEVAPTRIGGPGGASPAGRSRRPTSVAVVLLVALAIPALAFVGPRIEWRPEVDLSFLRPTPTPTLGPTPRPTPRPPVPTPSPLPRLLVEDGAPDRLAIDLDGIRLVDMTNGELGEPSPIGGENAAIVPAPDGPGWWCLCFDRTFGRPLDTLDLVVRHLDGEAGLTAEFPISSRYSTARAPSQDFVVRADADFAPDGRLAYVATATRAEDVWTIELESIDVAGGVSLGREVVATLDVPVPDPAAVSAGFDSYLAGPLLRLSPDGRRMTVVSSIDQYSSSGETLARSVSASIVELTGPGDPGGPIRSSTPLGGDLGERAVACSQLQWLDPETLVGSCWTEATSSLSATTFGLDGSLRRSADFGIEVPWNSEPLLDRAGRTVWFWNPIEHTLEIADLERGTVGRIEVDPEQTAIERPPARAAPVPTPDWASFRSSYSPWQVSLLSPERGGTRLYAVGMVQPPDSPGHGWGFGSTGVWVFDTATRSLVDRWQPGAAYAAIRLTRDERYLLAVGQPGTATDGTPSGWPSSVSVHDTSDGRLVAQLGRLGEGSGVLLPP